MKHNKLVLGLVLVLMVSMMALSPINNAWADEIKGTVEVSGEGEAQAVMVITDVGEEYTVKGVDLAAEAGKTVSVTGTVAEEDGQKVITATSYKVEE